MLESGASTGRIVVIDLGKTLSKVSLWTRSGRLVDRRVRPTTPLVVDGIWRLDVTGVERWLVDALRGFAAHPIDTIIPVGHGAGVVALGENGPAYPPLDYEQPIPPAVMTNYRAARDPFAVTGSPALPDGLNLGAQLFWLDQLYPQAAATTLVPWAQYWAWFLTGNAVSEVTSLGCHSDVWAPDSATFSPLAQRCGWARRFAPLVSAGAAAGTLRADLAAATGLSPEVRVLAGLHDSNAALLAARGFPEIASGEATILSTGTWFIAMRLAGEPVATAALPGSRDCLVNVDAYGRMVPSARFMGGREIERVIALDTRRVDIGPDQPALLAAVPGLVTNGVMLLPTLAPGCGPFPDHAARWLGEPDDCPEDWPDDWPDDWYARRAAMCLYAALVADTALDLIGSQDRILVEGRFAEAEVFVRALAALRPASTVYTANAHNDVSFGALRLIDPELVPDGCLTRVAPLDIALDAYRARWQAEIATESPA